MDTLKRTLFTDWHFMRWVRLIFGVFAVATAVWFNDGFMGIIGGFFLLTAFTNTGCCGASGCAVRPKGSQLKETEEVSFEEIKD